MTQTACVGDESPRVCPNCAADVDEFDAYVGGIDRICQVCLIELPVPSLVGSTRRRHIRVRRRRIRGVADRVTFPFESI